MRIIHSFANYLRGGSASMQESEIVVRDAG
jgi:hypothetical protein